LSDATTNPTVSRTVDLPLRHGAIPLWDIGVRGAGIVIAVLDSGVNREFLAETLISEIDFTTDHDPTDFTGHGTDMSRTITKIAPGSRIANVKVADKWNRAERDSVIRGLEYCRRNSPPIRVVNMSLEFSPRIFWFWRCTPEKPCNVCLKVNELASLGLIVVAAAGNTGLPYLSCPARAVGAYPIPAIEGKRNPFLDGAIEDHSSIRAVSGTSVSAAVTSGGIALLLSALPDLTLAEIREATFGAGRTVKHHNNMRIAHFYRTYRLLNHKRSGKHVSEKIATTHFELGRSLREAGDNAGAISELRKAIELAPYSNNFHNELGGAYGQAGQLEEARLAFQEALRLEWFLAESHFNLGMVLEKLGLWGKAIDHWLVGSAIDFDLYRQAVLSRFDEVCYYVILDNPADCPGEYVIREFRSTPHKPIPGEIIGRAQTFDEVRSKLPKNLHRVPRLPSDDKVIVETWLR